MTRPVPRRSRPYQRTSSAALLVVALALSATRAQAYEDQLTLGVGAGYGSALSDTQPRHGIVTDVAVSLGLDAVWSLRGRAAWGFHPADEAMHVLLGGGELLYLIDVLEVVPYFGFGLDAFGRVRRRTPKLDAAAHAVAGIDYLLSRDLTLELDLRAHVRVTDLDDDPIYLAVIVSTVFMVDL